MPIFALLSFSSSLALDHPFQHHRLSSELKLATGLVYGNINPSAPLSIIITNRPIHGTVLSISSDCSLDPRRVNISACTRRCLTILRVFSYSGTVIRIKMYLVINSNIQRSQVKICHNQNKAARSPPLSLGYHMVQYTCTVKTQTQKPKADEKHKSTPLKPSYENKMFWRATLLLCPAAAAASDALQHPPIAGLHASLILASELRPGCFPVSCSAGDEAGASSQHPRCCSGFDPPDRKSVV